MWLLTECKCAASGTSKVCLRLCPLKNCRRESRRPPALMEYGKPDGDLPRAVFQERLRCEWIVQYEHCNHCNDAARHFLK